MSLRFRMIFLYLGAFIQPLLLLANCKILPPEGAISPLFTFGHSILKSKSIAVAQEYYFIKQKPFPASVALTSAYWGATENITAIGTLMVYSQTPSLGATEIPVVKTGLGDFYAQANYLMYKNKTDDYRYRIIGVTGIYFPTSTVTERTYFTYNIPRFFFGVTYDAMSRDWFFYTD